MYWARFILVMLDAGDRERSRAELSEQTEIGALYNITTSFSRRINIVNKFENV